jgi:beta-galactosidase
MPASTVYDFNRGWLFGGEYVAKSEEPGFDDSRFVGVTLPHTVTGLSWADWKPATWQKKWIYRKHLDSSPLPQGRVFVDFDGVMASARIFLDGRQVGLHRGGYLPFSVELTSRMPVGRHVFAVKVDSEWQNVPPEGDPKGAGQIDFLEPGGIYRDVTLRVVPDIFISDVFAMPQGVMSPSPTLRVEVTIDAASAPPRPLDVHVELADGAATVASGATSVAITKAGNHVVDLTLTGLRKVALWSPSSPKLYTVRTTLTDHSGAELHSLDVRTGFRDVAFKLDGFHLNAKPFKLFGLNRHQLYPYLGMAASQRLQRRDAELLKNTLNCNMVRCSHYPQSPHFLDACDELGLMVWEEPPGWQYVGADKAFQNLVVQNVHDMVLRDRSRPSVIIWATRLNETDNRPKALYRQTRQTAEQLDSSRQTSGAMRIYSTKDWAQDVFAYDDYSLHTNKNAPPLKPPIHGFPYFVSETVGALDGPPLYRWIDSNVTLAAQAELHARKHNFARSSTAYAGLLGWAGIDYASLQGGNRNWHNMKWAGVLDTFRVPKPGAAFYRSQCSPKGNLIILPVFFWDFGKSSPATGPGRHAMIATNCDFLEFTIQGRPSFRGFPDHQHYGHLDHPPVFADLTTTKSAHPPELTIDGYVGTKKVRSIKMSGETAGDRLELTIEDHTIEANGHDATRFTFRAVDKYGNQRPYVTGEVTLSLSGPGFLTPDKFPFQTYGGVGGGYVRSYPRRLGTVMLTAKHPTLGTATGSVEVVPTQTQWI